MKDAIKELFLLGVGAASLTRKKAEKTLKVFVKKGVINKKQAREVLTRIMKETTKVRRVLRKEGEQEMKRMKRELSKTGKKASRKVNRKIHKAGKKVVRRALKK